MRVETLAATRRGAQGVSRCGESRAQLCYVLQFTTVLASMQLGCFADDDRHLLLVECTAV